MVDETKREEKKLKFRGAIGEFFDSIEHEVILAGPADTGKTFAGCWKMHIACATIPNTQVLLVRKNQNSLTGTIIRTFQRVIEGVDVDLYGGQTPTRFTYPNGSIVWTGGMDNPDACLSAERDYIYVNQAEELTESDWEVLSTRCSGRAAVVKNPQILGDANPGGAKHWIRLRAADGRLRLLAAKHTDNPTIYDIVNGQYVITEDGKKRLAVLDNLSGVRRKRLFEGLWATSEGAVYDMFDNSIHVKERPDSEMVDWYLAVDRGYTDPFVVLLVGKDYDKRLHVKREFYKRGALEEDMVALIKEWNAEFKCSMCVCDDSAAAFIAACVVAGINAIPAEKGRIMDGIPFVQNRLKVAGDGKPRLTIDPSCINTINEFESYVFKPGKDMPEDKDNHSMDAIRYLIRVVERGSGSFDSSSSIYVPPGQGARFVSTRTFAPRPY